MNSISRNAERPRRRGLWLAAIGALLALGIWALIVLDPGGWFHETPRLPGRSGSYAIATTAPTTWDAPLPLLAEGAAGGGLREYQRRLRRFQVQRFEADYRWLEAAEATEDIAAEVRLRETPLTPDAVLDSLPASVSEHRAEIEGQVLESTLLVRVPGVSAADLLRFHTFSRFELTRRTASSTVGIEMTGPLNSTPLHLEIDAEQLPANQGLRQEVTDRYLVRKPTGYTNAIVYDIAGPVKVYRYVMLRNEPPPGGADVHLSAGVFMTADRDGHALLWHRSYFHGQKIPGLGRGMILGQIQRGYREFGALYRELAAEWIRRNPEPGTP